MFITSLILTSHKNVNVNAYLETERVCVRTVVYAHTHPEFCMAGRS